MTFAHLPSHLAALLLRGGDHWPWALGALALFGAALAVLYPPQLRGTRRRWQWLLPALRGAALAALAVSVVKPVVTRTRTAGEEGAVAILVDRSGSTGVTDRLLEGSDDPRRAIGQTVALADSLGRLPEGARRKTNEVLAQDFARIDAQADAVVRARRELDYARVAGRDTRTAGQNVDAAVMGLRRAAESALERVKREDPRSPLVKDLAEVLKPGIAFEGQWLTRMRALVARARAEAQSAQDRLDESVYLSDPDVQTLCLQTASMSRLALGWEALAGGNDSLLARLDRATPVAGYGFGDVLDPLELRGARLGALGSGTEPAGVEPDAGGSDVVGAVRRVLQQSARTPLQAVVVFTDGRQVGAAAPAPASVLPSGVPVYPVFTASGRTRDLAIERVEIPESIFDGEALPIRVHVSAVNLDPRRVSGEATLEVGGKPAATAALSARERGFAPIEFELRQLPAGVHRVRVRLPRQPGEATGSNNVAERWVKVLSQRLRIAVIAGSANWDHRFVRDALARARFVKLKEMVIRPGGVAEISPAEIYSQDLLILNDVAPEALDTGQWEAVRELVRDAGGSLIIIPGFAHPQHEWGENPSSDLLPYPLSIRPSWQIWPGESAHYQAALATGEEWLEALRLGADVEENVRRWDELPGFYRFLSIPQKHPDARLLLVERSTQAPLLTEMRVGLGRAFFLATNETWRWRRRVGDRDHERFWLQLVRHALGEPYTKVGRRLSMDLDHIVIGPDQGVRVRAKLAPRDNVAPGAAASPLPGLDLFIFRNGQYHGSGRLEPIDQGRGGRYAASFSELPAGDYEFSASVPADVEEGSDFEEQTMPLRVERGTEQELADVSGDRALLEQIAEATGGRCVDLEDVDELPKLIAETRQRQTRVVELPLWDSPYLFLFVLGCFALEWALRKRLGMA